MDDKKMFKDEVDEGCALDEAVSYLAECFTGVDMELLMDAALLAEGNRDQAVDFVLSRMFEQKEAIIDLRAQELECWGMSQEQKEITSRLNLDFPNVELEVIVALVMNRQENESIDDLAEMLTPHWEQNISKLKKKEYKPLAPKPISSRSPARVAYPSSRRETMNEIEKRIYFALLGTDECSDDLRDQDSKEFREKAAEIQKKRLQFYEQASSHFHSGGVTGKMSAQYFAQEGNALKREIEAINNRAAYLIYRRLYFIPCHIVNELETRAMALKNLIYMS